MAGGAVQRGGAGRPRHRPHRLVGDKAYSSRQMRQYRRRHGIRVTIPRQSNEHCTGPFGRPSYRQRKKIERLINRYKQCGTKNGRPTIRPCGSSPRSSYGGLCKYALRSSLEFAVAGVGHLGFYALFDELLDQYMVVLVQLAMDHAWARQVDLSGPLAGVTNRNIFDSVTVKVQEVLLTDFPLSESYIRVHKALSVPMPASTVP